MFHQLRTIATQVMLIFHPPIKQGAENLFWTQDTILTSMDISALDQHSDLKDTSDMKWYHSKDDEQPLLMPKEKASGLSGKGESLVLSNSSVSIDKFLHTIM